MDDVHHLELQHHHQPRTRREVSVWVELGVGRLSRRRRLDAPYLRRDQRVAVRRPGRAKAEVAQRACHARHQRALVRAAVAHVSNAQPRRNSIGGQPRLEQLEPSLHSTEPRRASRVAKVEDGQVELLCARQQRTVRRAAQRTSNARLRRASQAGAVAAHVVRQAETNAAC